MTTQGPTWEYLHLIAVLFPVALAVSGALVGVVGWAIRREGLERWGLVSLLLAGVLSVPAYFTGLTAADVAATRTFVRPSAVQTHRVWATWTTLALLAQAVFAAFALFQPADARLRRFVLLLSVAGAALVSWSALLGGKIVHGPATDAERIEETVDGPGLDRPGGIRVAEVFDDPILERDGGGDLETERAPGETNVR